MHAATQQPQGTIAAVPLLHPVATAKPPLTEVVTLKATPLPMTSHKPRQYSIQGVTKDGRTFRPSDWAERLAGAMSSFRPGGSAGGIGAYIGYSPYCVPRTMGTTKCVVVHEALRDIEPMAWDFVMDFARDNDLQVAEVTGASDG